MASNPFARVQMDLPGTEPIKLEFDNTATTEALPSSTNKSSETPASDVAFSSLPPLRQPPIPLTHVFGSPSFPAPPSEALVTKSRDFSFNDPASWSMQKPASPPRHSNSSPILNPLQSIDFMGPPRQLTPSESTGMSVCDPHQDAPEDAGITHGYLQLVANGDAMLTDNHESGAMIPDGAVAQEIITCPLFSNHVRMALGRLNLHENPFPQYGLLGIREAAYNARYPDISGQLSAEENLIFTNGNAPWSTFICGSQGAGKSHSLGCLLENALLPASPAGENPRPLAGLVFHYDRFTSNECTQLCEAAYLCSSGVPVRVLVSPSNFHTMHKLYSNLPGLKEDKPRPQVLPLYFQEEQLNISRMMTLMAVNENGPVPLYIETLYKVLRDMSTEMKGASGLDYLDFKRRLERQGFTSHQNVPLKLRLELLESFLAHRVQSDRSGALLKDIFKSAHGTLTIVDLSCPFVNENDACSLFSICLSIFMENRADCGRVLALDEAHKFLTQSGAAEKLTDQLTSIVRQQRHLATRVIVATQEPTLAPRLLDLCNVSIVHRFNSPAWFQHLQNHLAGARLGQGQSNAEVFEMIVGLQTGEALIFCPSALLDVLSTGVHRLKDSFVRVRIRSRVTADGGRSIMASDAMMSLRSQDPSVEELIKPFAAPANPSQYKSDSAVPKPVRSSSSRIDNFFDSKPSSSSTSEPIKSGSLNHPGTPARDQNSFGRPTDNSFQRLARSATAASASVVPVCEQDTVAPASRRVGTQPGTKVSVDEVITLLRRLTSESLMRDNRILAFATMRRDAARALSLPDEYFETKAWRKICNPCIHAHMAQYAQLHGFPKPVPR